MTDTPTPAPDDRCKHGEYLAVCLDCSDDAQTDAPAPAPDDLTPDCGFDLIREWMVKAEENCRRTNRPDAAALWRDALQHIEFAYAALAARDAEIERLRVALRDVRQCGIADQCEECSHAIDAALAAERKDTP